MFGAGMTVLNRALEDLGIDMINSAFIDIHDSNEIFPLADEYGIDEAVEIASLTKRGPDWFVINQSPEPSIWESILHLATLCQLKGLQAIVFLTQEQNINSYVWHMAKTLTWHLTQTEMTDSLLGGGTDLTSKVITISPYLDDEMLSSIWNDPELKSQNSTEKFTAIYEVLDKVVPGADEWITPQDEKKQVQWMAPQHLAKISSYARINNTDWLPVFNTANPLPRLTQADIAYVDGSILIEIQDPVIDKVIRPLHWTEAARAIGLRESDLQAILNNHIQVQDIWNLLRQFPTKGILRGLATTLHMAYLIETTKKNSRCLNQPDLSCYVSPKLHAFVTTTTTSQDHPSAQTIINRWSTIPLPTHKEWVNATAADPNLSLIIDAMTNHAQLDRHSMPNKAFFAPFDKQLFEFEEGILYYTTEPTAMNIRQLR
jgi:hypothetical protein